MRIASRTSWVLALVALLWLSGLVWGQQQGGDAEATMAKLIELNNKATAFANQGKYAEAKPLAEEVVSLAEKTLGPDNPDTATVLNNLANILQKMEDLQGARPLYERALAIYERALGPDHPNVAESLNGLAELLRTMGDLEGARPLCERALAIREKTLGPGHPDTAMSLNRLGGLLALMGDLKGAKPLLERALAIYEKVLGSDNIYTALGLSNLAEVLQEMGDVKGARLLFERALAIDEKVRGPDHPDTATCLCNLAHALSAMGDLKGARPLIERALIIHEKVLGSDHPLTARSLGQLAIVLSAMGDPKGARPLYERALGIYEKALGPDHHDTGMSRRNLAGVLKDMGDLKAAKALFERALAIHVEALGADHIETAGSLNDLACVLGDMGDLKGARPLIERALAIREKVLGSSHPATANSLTNLAALLKAMGDLKGARPLCERALVIIEKALGPDHPNTATSLNNLACVLQAMGDLKEARSLYGRAWDVNRKDFLSLLPALSDEERCGLMRSREDQLSCYITGFADDASLTCSALLAWKGAALRASAAQRLPADASVEARAVNDELVEKRRAYARLATSPPTPKPGEPSVAEQYQTARDDVGRLERKLGELLPEFAKRAFLDVTVADVQEALPADTALVEMIENSGIVHAWVVRKGAEPLYWKLGNAKDLGDLAKAFREALVADDQDAWKKAGGSLRERLKGPLDEALAHAKTLYISPDGALATIPFALLPDGDGFLIERCPVVTVMGGAALVMASRTKRNTICQGLLALGDVDYNAAEGATGKGIRAEHQAPSLSATRAEVQQVRERFHARFAKEPCTALTGKDATEAAFLREAPKARFIHAATHGYFDLEHVRVAFGAESTRGFSGGITSTAIEPEAPTMGGPSIGPAQSARRAGWNPLLLSGLVLAGANQGDGGHGDDGSLTAEELQSLDLTGTDLVVLSACETGCGELAAGEGVLGLGRSLFVAGARGFMLSLWQVPDASTRDLMDGFYDGLWTQGLSAEDALRATQLKMLARDREKNAFHPKDWGAWVLIR